MRALRALVITVQVMFDQGAHSGKGLGEAERSKFQEVSGKSAPRICHQRNSVRAPRPGRRVSAAARILGNPVEIPGARAPSICSSPTRWDTISTATARAAVRWGRGRPRRRSGGDPFYKSFLGLAGRARHHAAARVRASLHPGHAAPSYGRRQLLGGYPERLLALAAAPRHADSGFSRLRRVGVGAVLAGLESPRTLKRAPRVQAAGH